MESGGSGAGGNGNGSGNSAVQKTCCIEERAAGQVAGMGGWLTGDDNNGQMARRGGGGGVEERWEQGRHWGRDSDSDRNNRQMTHDTTGAWYNANGWCDPGVLAVLTVVGELLTVNRWCQLLIGYACNNSLIRCGNRLLLQANCALDRCYSNNLCSLQSLQYLQPITVPHSNTSHSLLPIPSSPLPLPLTCVSYYGLFLVLPACILCPRMFVSFSARHWTYSYSVDTPPLCTLH